MDHNDIRALLLHPHFCRAGKLASHRDRYEANLRAIFRALIFFSPYTTLDQFWPRFARRLCPFWSGQLLETTVLLFVDGRQRYLEGHSHARDHRSARPQARDEVVKAIDSYLHRPPRSQSSRDLGPSFEKALQNWDPERWMWPSQSTDIRGSQLSVKESDARNDFPSSRGEADQYRPQRSWGPSISIREIPGRSGDANSNKSSLASRAPVLPESGSVTAMTAVAADDDAKSHISHPREPPHNTLKRTAPSPADLGPSKRRVGNTDLNTPPTPEEPEQTEVRQRDTSSECLAETNVPTPKEDTEVLNSQEENEPLNPEEAMAHPEVDQANKHGITLEVLEELLNKGFVGIEAQFRAFQEQISRNTTLHTDTEQTVPSPQQIPPAKQYLDEYLRDGNHDVLIKGVGNEIRKLKADLFHGFKDLEHDQTSETWKRMESVWLALDEAEKMAMAGNS